MNARKLRYTGQVIFGAANFAGSGVLGTMGVVTLTRVQHRRELLFDALPSQFAIHRFIQVSSDRARWASLWCAYAAIASVIILRYFWKSHTERAFAYAAIL